jgi:hypothetical protein
MKAVGLPGGRRQCQSAVRSTRWPFAGGRRSTVPLPLRVLRSTATDPDSLEARQAAGHAHVELENFEETSTHSQQILDIDPGNGGAHCGLALSYYQGVTWTGHIDHAPAPAPRRQAHTSNQS